MKAARFSGQSAAIFAALGLSFASVHCGSDSDTASGGASGASVAGASARAGAPATGGSQENAGSAENAGLEDNGGSGGDSGAGAGDIAQAGSGDATETIPAFNGCTTPDYEDRSGAADDRTIAIASMGLSFTPQCLTIRIGQTVRWEGSLATHPLAPGNPDHPDAGTAGSPILETTGGQSVEFTFTNVGTFPYYCEVHSFGDGMGMAGVVHVKP